MDLIDALFSRDSRVRRKTFWIGTGLVAAPMIAAVLFLPSPLAGGALVLGGYPATNLSMNRLHDMGRSSVWLLIPWSVAIFAGVISLIDPGEQLTLLGIAAAMVTAVFALVLSFADSDPLENDWGAPEEAA